jgi:hypothetical protein
MNAAIPEEWVVKEINENISAIADRFLQYQLLIDWPKDCVQLKSKNRRNRSLVFAGGDDHENFGVLLPVRNSDLPFFADDVGRIFQTVEGFRDCPCDYATPSGDDWDQRH